MDIDDIIIENWKTWNFDNEINLKYDCIKNKEIKFINEEYIDWKQSFVINYYSSFDFQSCT